MTYNPILEEIYAARDKLLADYKGDVHAYVEDARKRALASGRPIAAVKKRDSRLAGGTKSIVSTENETLPPADR